MSFIVNKVRKSFTLIEMLIVIVIIGILAAALVPRLLSVQDRARDTKRKVDLNQIFNAVLISYEDNGVFPQARNASVNCTTSSGFVTCNAASDKGTSLTGWIQDLVPTYMTSLPTDPKNVNTLPSNLNAGPWTTGNYLYAYTVYWNTYKKFSLTTRLENINDPEICENKAPLIYINSSYNVNCSYAGFSGTLGWSAHWAPSWGMYDYTVGRIVN